MKVFFYIWCCMALLSLIAMFFNPSHIVTCCMSGLLAYAAYPDEDDEN